MQRGIKFVLTFLLSIYLLGVVFIGGRSIVGFAVLEQGSPQYQNLIMGNSIAEDIGNFFQRLFNKGGSGGGEVYLSEPDVACQAKVSGGVYSDSFTDEDCIIEKNNVSISNGNVVPQVDNSAGTLANGLVGLWHFDETSGNAIDAAGGNHGIPQGVIQGQAGKFGNAYNFSKYGWVFMLGNVPNIFNDSFTISAWFKRFSTTDDGYFFDTNSSGNSYTTLRLYSTSVRPQVGNGTKSSQIIYNINADMQWHNFVFTRNKQEGKIHLYLDGKDTVVAGDGDPISLDFSGIVPFVVGKRHQDHLHDFNGTIDEVAIWNRNLSISEITTVNASAINYYLTPGNFTSKQIYLGSEYNSVVATWDDPSIKIEITSDGNNWCELSSGEILRKTTCAQLPANNFTYRATFSSNVNLSSVNFAFENYFGAEICGNGVDDDGDGKADCFDSDCFAYPACQLSGTMAVASRTSGVLPLAVFFDAVDEADWTSRVVQPKGFDNQTEIDGVKISRVSTSTALGSGTLQYSSSGKTLSWRNGPAVDVSSGGNFVLTSGIDKVFVWTDPAKLPLIDMNDDVEIVDGGLNADWNSYFYEWDFGDPAPLGTSPTDPLWYWENGAKKSDGSWFEKNKAFGWNAAHVYENVGTHTVTLKIIDDEDNEHIYSQPIVVALEPVGGWKNYYISSTDGNDSYYDGLCQTGSDFSGLIKSNNVDGNTKTQGYSLSSFTLKDSSGNLIGYMENNGWSATLAREVYSDVVFTDEIGSLTISPKVYDYPGFNLDSGPRTVSGLTYNTAGGVITTGNVLYAENPVLLADTVIEGSTVKNSTIINSEIKNAYVENSVVVNSKIYATNSSTTTGKTINSKVIHESWNTICGPLANWDASTTKAGANARLRFKRGENFPVFYSWNPSTMNSPVQFDSYGSGGRPIFKPKNDNNTKMIGAGSLSDLRVIDFDIHGNYTDSMMFEYLGKGSLILRTRFYRTGQNSAWNTLAFVVDSEFDQVRRHAIFHGFDNGTMKRMVIIGSDFVGPGNPNGEALNRFYSSKLVVEHNNYAHQSTIKAQMRLI